MGGWRFFLRRPRKAGPALVPVRLSENARRAQRGAASLPAIAVTLAVAGTILLLTQGGITRFDRASQTETMTSLDHIAEALVAHAAVVGNLPCPDTDNDGDPETSCSTSSSQEKGTVPYKALGLELNDVIDRWGRMVSYRVDENMAETGALQSGKTSKNKLTICEADQTTCSDDNKRLGEVSGKTDNEAAFILISHGPSGHGGMLPSGTAVHPHDLGDWEDENTAGISGTDNVFYGLPFNTLNDNGEPLDLFDQEEVKDHFDDIVHGISIADLYAGTGNEPGLPTYFELTGENVDDLISTAEGKGGKGGTEKFHAGKDADGNPYLAVGSKDNQGGINQMKNGAVACIWLPKPLRWDPDKTFRAAFLFQFAPGENDLTEDKGDGEGFTFTILPGPRKLTWDHDANAATDEVGICGQDSTDSNMGNGYKNGSLSIDAAVYDPDFPYDIAFEPDPSPKPSGSIRMPKLGIEFDVYNNDYGDEKALEKNHVAILSTYNLERIGNGTHTNPPCPSGTSASGLYQDASTELLTTPAKRGCTYSDFSSWMEYESRDAAADWFVGNKGAPVHAARLEIERLCNADCSECGKAGETNMWYRAWVQEVGNPSSLVDAKVVEDMYTQQWQDFAEFATGNRPKNFVNYCGPDPGEQSSFRENYAAFDTFRVGFTAAARAAAGKGGNGTSVYFWNVWGRTAE